MRTPVCAGETELTRRRHTIKAFLDKGYHVRGTVRTEEKGQYLQDLFKDSSSVFEYVVVPDIAKVGCLCDRARR